MTTRYLDHFRWAIHQGGAEKLAREAGEAARKEAVQRERELHLEVCEKAQAELVANPNEGSEPGERLYLAACLELEIKRLRRCLGIRPTPDQIREQTRERTQRWRERTRAAAGM